MSKTLATYLFALVASSTNAQIVNNLSADRTNIYFHAVDSVVKIVRQNHSFREVEIIAERFIIGHFPDSVVGLKIVKTPKDSKRRPKLRKEQARILLMSMEIIRDEFKIPILARDRDGFIGDGMYILSYQYMPETRTYVLTRIRSGIVL